MRAFLHYEQYKPHQLRVMSQLSLGLARHGVHCDLSDEWNPGALEADFVVCWGNKVPHIWNGPKQLILEAGYINGRSGNYHQDRLQFISAGWDGLHGRADPGPPGRPPSDRWDALDLEMAPWRRSQGEYWLICDQHPGDSVAPGDPGWWREADALAGSRGIRAIYRPHPLLAPDLAPLRNSLSNASRCITWNSTSAIEAVMMGVPTVAMDRGSIAWDVCAKRPEEPDYVGSRAEWGYSLAYRQWTSEELADGTAWDHLRYYVE